jgi:hypothetical protein
MDLQRLKTFRTVATLMNLNKAVEVLHYLPHILCDYQPRFPGVRLDITSCAMHSLEHELRIGTIDLAFFWQIIEMNSIEAIKQTIRDEIEVTLIPEIAIWIDVEKKEMAKVCWVDDLETGLLMIHYKDKWCSPARESIYGYNEAHYRVYYTIREKETIFLLAGGDKSTQSDDIEKANQLLKSLEEVHTT